MSEDRNFYRAFEDKHRGSRELIKSRLQAYRPFVEPLLNPLPTKRAIDLGCGRGEWLELAEEIGFEPYGVDLDEGMLQAAKQSGLPVGQHDALEFLKGQPDDCVAVISGFHIVEHIRFSDLQELVQQAFRVLTPGGLLIMETPNPENVVVGSHTFYLDPTHKRPIPPDLLSFVPEYYGFERVKILRLQEDPLIDRRPINLLDILGGVSPDYAVVAQKPGLTTALEATQEAFDTTFGTNLVELALRHEDQTNAGFADLEHRLNLINREFNLNLRGLKETAQLALDVARAAESAAHTELEAIHNSRSWRITAPLRWLALQVHLLRQFGFTARARALWHKLLGRRQQVSETQQQRALQLTPRARALHADLLAAVSKHEERR